MKKTLIALAALAAAGVVSAQSSVTLYGRLDLGSAQTKTDSRNALGVTTTAKSTSLAGAESNLTTGRLGVRGVEDLGNGLKAGFNIETRVNADATAATFGNTRTAVLQVMSTDLGTFSIGTYKNLFDTVRDTTVSILGAPGGDFLANVHSGSLTTGISTLFGTGVPLPGGFNTRSQNSVTYSSPVFGNGFVATFGTSNEKVEANGVTTGKSTGYVGGLGYANGPLTSQFAFGSAKVIAAADDRKINDYALSVKYDFGFAVPYFTFERTKNNSNIAANLTSRIRSFELGSKFPIQGTAFTPYVTVSRSKITTEVGAPAVATDWKANAYQLGSYYTVSKRTSAYAGYGRDKFELQAPNSIQQTRRGYAIGLVHQF